MNTVPGRVSLGPERPDSRVGTAVSSWDVFAERAPELAELGRRILKKYGIAYLATIRADGAPRVHPVSPVIRRGVLLVGVIGESPKRRDLDRDGRFVLHALPGPQDTEFVVRGVARRLSAELSAELAAQRREQRDDAVDTVFYELDLVRVDITAYHQGTGIRPVPTRSCWQADEVTT